jgi:D-alanyl-D-alanine carboxypeptidase
MRPHDRFRAGSLTNPFVAAVVLQLVEEGRVALDDPISSLLPDQVAGMFANSDKITVRMLLNHTSGLPDFMDVAGPELNAHLDKVWEVEECLDFASAQEPRYAPGEGQYYSNTGYADFGGGIVDATELATASVVGAAGGQSLITNAADLTRFMEALLAGQLFQKSETLDEMLTFAGALFDGALVSKESLAEMATPLGEDAENGVVWGLGGATVETLPGAFGMEGGIPGYSAFFIGVQDTKLVVATLLNSEEGDVIAPSLMAFQYLTSLPSAGQEPVTPVP